MSSQRFGAPPYLGLGASKIVLKDLLESISALKSAVIMDFKDTVYPFFESDTLFLESIPFALFLVVWRFFESSDI